VVINIICKIMDVYSGKDNDMKRWTDRSHEISSVNDYQISRLNETKLIIITIRKTIIARTLIPHIIKMILFIGPFFLIQAHCT